jgi:hypothetical protein
MENYKKSRAELKADYYITSPDYSHPNLGKIYTQMFLAINMCRSLDLNKACEAFKMIESDFIITRKLDLKTFELSWKYLMSKIVKAIIEGNRYETLQKEYIDAFAYYSNQKIETKEQLIQAISNNLDKDLAYRVLLRTMMQGLAGEFNLSDKLVLAVDGKEKIVSLSRVIKRLAQSCLLYIHNPAINTFEDYKQMIDEELGDGAQFFDWLINFIQENQILLIPNILPGFLSKSKPGSSKKDERYPCNVISMPSTRALKNKENPNLPPMLVPQSPYAAELSFFQVAGFEQIKEEDWEPKGRTGGDLIERQVLDTVPLKESFETKVQKQQYSERRSEILNEFIFEMVARLEKVIDDTYSIIEDFMNKKYLFSEDGKLVNNNQLDQQKGFSTIKDKIKVQNKKNKSLTIDTATDPELYQRFADNYIYKNQLFRQIFVGEKYCNYIKSFTERLALEDNIINKKLINDLTELFNSESYNSALIKSFQINYQGGFPFLLLEGLNRIYMEVCLRIMKYHSIEIDGLLKEMEVENPTGLLSLEHAMKYFGVKLFTIRVILLRILYLHLEPNTSAGLDIQKNEPFTTTMLLDLLECISPKIKSQLSNFTISGTNPQQVRDSIKPILQKLDLATYMITETIINKSADSKYTAEFINETLDGIMN